MGLFELLQGPVMDAPRFSFGHWVIFKLFVESVSHALSKCIDPRTCRAFGFLIANAFVVTARVIGLCTSSKFDGFALGRCNPLRALAMLTNICSTSLGQGVVIGSCIL